MANMLLTAAGTAVAGPVGGALGSVLGRQIDQANYSSLRNRLSDLRIPSSQYGDLVPRIIHRMRVAGIVLWAAQPVELATVSKSGTEAGRSISFAYGLSTGRVGSIARIWADGRLIRDQNGLQEVSFSLRLHDGDEDQPSDPLIASVLGQELAPAFRGIAYLVFENFDLSSFGNRLPLLTVEIDGQGGQVTAEEVIASCLGEGKASSEGGHEIGGYALSGDDVASAIAPLSEAFEPSFRYAEDGWSIDRSLAHHVIDERLWTLTNEVKRPRRLGGVSERPTKVSLRYFDPANDFAAGEKSARLPGPERLKRIELPATLTGEQAKDVASEELARWSGENLTHRLQLPLSFHAIRVGDEVSCASDSESRLVVSEVSLQPDHIALMLKAPAANSAAGRSGAISASTQSAIRRAPLLLSMVELPGGMFESDPEVALLVSGGHEPFQPLPITVSTSGMEQVVGSATQPSSVGTLLTELPASAGELIDQRNTIAVAFEKDPGLLSCGDEALLSGANLAWLNGEFIQFATARALGAAKYELSDLLRARFDSAVPAVHASGSAIILLKEGSYSTIRPNVGSIGATVRARVHGPDEALAETSLELSGLSARPWSPAHLSIIESEAGLAAHWMRRCKEGAPWLDEVDAPLGCSRERYLVTISDSNGAEVSAYSDQPSVFLTAQTLTELGARPWHLSVRQLGDFAASKPSARIIE